MYIDKVMKLLNTCRCCKVNLISTHRALALLRLLRELEDDGP